MAKMLLTCLVSSAPVSSNEPDARLLSSLMTDLEELQKSLEEKAPSLQWCSEGIAVIKRSHSRLLLHLEMSNMTAISREVNMLDEYLRATLDVLDLCNLLKSAVSSLNRYMMMINFMVKRLEDSSFPVEMCRTELESLETEKNKKLLNLRTRKDMSLIRGVSKVKINARVNSSSMHVLQAIKSTMSIISAFILCSILHIIPIKIDEGFCAEFWNLDSDKESIKKISTTCAKECQYAEGKKKPILQEIEMIVEAFAAFKQQVSSAEKSDEDNRKQSECADMLKNSCAALKEGINSFERVIDELFEDVIKGRNKVINLISKDNYTA